MKRFAALLAISVALHAALVGGVFGVFAYRTARAFSMFRWDSGDDYTSRVQVASGSSAPLKYPSGFFAVKVAPKLIERPKPKPEDEPKPVKPKPEKEPKKAEKPKPEKAGAGDAAKGDGAAPVQPPQPAPTGTPTFGVIRGNAFTPHLKAVYSAYEQGKLPDTPFRVTVTCTVEADGSLGNIKVVKSSGNDTIDETAINLFRELSAMKALAPLQDLSSLSLTLDRGEASSTLTAVGFASSYGQAETLARQNGIVQQAASWSAKDADQTALVRSTKISQTGTRVSVSCTLPNGRVADMMRKSYGPAAPQPAA